MELIRIALPGERSEFGRSQIQSSFSKENTLIKFFRNQFFFIQLIEAAIIGRDMSRTEEVHFIERSLTEPFHHVRKVVFEEACYFLVLLYVLDAKHFQNFFGNIKFNLFLTQIVVRFPLNEWLGSQVLPDENKHSGDDMGQHVCVGEDLGGFVEYGVLAINEEQPDK